MDSSLTPDIAIVDSAFAATMPPLLTAHTGIDALVHAMESFVSVAASEWTRPLSLEAIRLLFRYLPITYHHGDLNAREKVHHASSIAGMAYANAFLGICHSLAHQLGSVYNLPHGLANALVLEQVIRFNAVDCPFKTTPFPAYQNYRAKQDYAEIATVLDLAGQSTDERVQSLLTAVHTLKAQLNIPNSIAIALPHVSEEQFCQQSMLMAEHAFDDQCTSANPREPLISELQQILHDAWHGK